MKKVFSALLCVLVISIGGVVLYSRAYTITNDKKQLVDSIKQFSDDSTMISSNISIKQELNLDNKKYVLFLKNFYLGEAELTKGLNNKYKIKTIGYDSGFFREEICKTNKGKYLILKGENFDGKIAYAKVLLDNKEYKISIPHQEYFVVYCSVPIETERVFLDTNDIKFYDINNVDITSEMYKLFFSI